MVKKTFIIAEVGLAHEGSLGIAKSFVDKISEAKADAVKFQIHDHKSESSIYEKFKKKYRVPFELLSDPDLKMHKKYGVWGVKTFMGKKFLGTIRSSVFIDNGKIKKIWSKVRVNDHAKEVFNFVRSYK